MFADRMRVLAIFSLKILNFDFSSFEFLKFKTTFIRFLVRILVRKTSILVSAVVVSFDYREKGEKRPKLGYHRSRASGQIEKF